MNVLLIEDEVHLAEGLTHILKKEKYSVDACYDGESGLNAALSNRYDVILLDLMLPKMNGYDVLERLRNASVTTPVLILTARGQVMDKVKGLDLGRSRRLFGQALFLSRAFGAHKGASQA